jgi:hypothetical protein
MLFDAQTKTSKPWNPFKGVVGPSRRLAGVVLGLSKLYHCMNVQGY